MSPRPVLIPTGDDFPEPHVRPDQEPDSIAALAVDDEPWVGVSLFEFAIEFRYSIGTLLSLIFCIAYAVLR